MGAYVARFARLFLGLALLSFGGCMAIHAGIGLAPWDAFTMGVAYLGGVSYGVSAIATGFLILVLDRQLGERLGLGTAVNTVCIGAFMDGINYAGVIPEMRSFPQGVAMLLAGQAIICVGTFFYIGAGLGCGPRDALMVALCRRLPGSPVGAVRAALEGTVLLAGWLLGAEVGPGTVISALGLGFVMQAVFSAMRFDVAAVRHEGFAETLSRMALPRLKPRA